MSSRYGLQIRAAAPPDAAALADLMTHAGRPAGASILAARLDAWHGTPGAVLMAVEWGPPSGLVALHWFQTLSDDMPVAQIDLLLVDPDARRRGIGRALLKAASQAARTAGCGAIQIAAPSNAASLEAFCRATGFDTGETIYRRALRKRA